MTPLEIALLDAVQSARRVRSLRAKFARAGPLAMKELRRQVRAEESMFRQLSDRALAMVDEHITGRNRQCTSSGGGKP